MVTTVDEVRQFQRLVSATMRDLDSEGKAYSRDFKLGVMIEVPAAALIADILAREVDFFSIGTNDLIQYALAVDRNNEHVSYLYRPLHPAVLRMVRSVIDSAHAAGIEVSMCGEMAADGLSAAVLLGLGLKRYSLNPRRIPPMKDEVRRLSVNDCKELARECLGMSTAAEVEDRVETFLKATG
jgi:phosphotransferase system enzyme I (PtsI)